MNALLAVVAVVVIGSVLVALVLTVVVGAFRPGYDVDACWAAFEERKAQGQVPEVMEPEDELVS